MNLYKKFVEEKELEKDYQKWLEHKVASSYATLEPTSKPDEVEPETIGISNYNDIGHYFFNDDTLISYEGPSCLSGKVQINFKDPFVSKKDIEKLVGICNYWSNIPYVTTEGNYGYDWDNNNTSFILYVDVTKSASDDIMAREILEKLAEWIEFGTPTRVGKTKKHYGLGIKPKAVILGEY